MKRILLTGLICSLAICTAQSQNSTSGEKLFKSTCSPCHTIGKGKLVGPDLSGIHTKRNEKWMISFIKSSQTMVKSNDPAAVKIFNEYNKMVMPDQPLTDVQIKDVLAYIKTISPAPPKPAQSSSVAPAQAKPAPAKPAPPPVPTWVHSEHQVKSKKNTREIDPKNLDASFWRDIPAETIPVSPQNVAYPNVHNSTVDAVHVKCVYGNNLLAFLIEWKDPSRDTEVDVDRFCDQLAIQLPVDVHDIPSYMMGNAGGKVHIIHWKAIWQEDCENGFRDVQDKYPNMWVDVYPGLEAHLDRSKRIYAQDITAEHIVDTRSYTHMPGTYSKNPMSQIKRKEPLEEAVAEGFGTLATQETQAARGWAEWKDGQWRVCMIVPVNTGNIYKASFKDKTKVAFAVWDGGNKNIGGRKHYSPWVDVFLEQ